MHRYQKRFWYHPACLLASQDFLHSIFSSAFSNLVYMSQGNCLPPLPSPVDLTVRPVSLHFPCLVSPIPPTYTPRCHVHSFLLFGVFTFLVFVGSHQVPPELQLSQAIHIQLSKIIPQKSVPPAACLFLLLSSELPPIEHYLGKEAPTTECNISDVAIAESREVTEPLFPFSPLTHDAFTYFIIIHFVKRM